MVRTVSSIGGLRGLVLRHSRSGRLHHPANQYAKQASRSMELDVCLLVRLVSANFESSSYLRFYCSKQTPLALSFPLGGSIEYPPFLALAFPPRLPCPKECLLRASTWELSKNDFLLGCLQCIAFMIPSAPCTGFRLFLFRDSAYLSFINAGSAWNCRIYALIGLHDQSDCAEHPEISLLSPLFNVRRTLQYDLKPRMPGLGIAVIPVIFAKSLRGRR